MPARLIDPFFVNLLIILDMVSRVVPSSSASICIVLMLTISSPLICFEYLLQKSIKRDITFFDESISIFSVNSLSRFD